MARDRQFTGDENIYAFFSASSTPVRSSLEDLLAFDTSKKSESTWSAPLYAKRRSNAALLAAADALAVTDDAPAAGRVLRPRK